MKAIPLPRYSYLHQYSLPNAVFSSYLIPIDEYERQPIENLLGKERYMRLETTNHHYHWDHGSSGDWSIVPCPEDSYSRKNKFILALWSALADAKVRLLLVLT